jgi:hypothetical protein
VDDVELAQLSFPDMLAEPHLLELGLLRTHWLRVGISTLFALLQAWMELASQGWSEKPGLPGGRLLGACLSPSAAGRSTRQMPWT